MWATTLWKNDMMLFQWSVVLAAAWVAAMCDLVGRRIPNLLTLPLLLTALAWATWLGRGAGLADALCGCVIAALPYIILFLFAGGGAGDAKMMGAIGAWLGVINATVALAAVAMIGGLLAILFALASGRLRSVMHNLSRIGMELAMVVTTRHWSTATPLAMPRTGGMQAIPYGVAIFIGVCVAAGSRYLQGA